MRYLAYAHLVFAFMSLFFFFKVLKTGKIITGEPTFMKSLVIVLSYLLWYATGATLAFMIIGMRL